MNISLVNRAVLLSRAPTGDPWLDELIEREGLGIASENYYRFLYHLVRLGKPEVAIELGVEYGVGSAHMAAAASRYGGKVIGIDHNSHDLPRVRIPERYPRTYRFVLGDTLEAMNEFFDWDIRGKVGLVYQDSSHHYQASKDEWAIYSRLLAPGAVWVCDDITPAFHDPLIDPPGKGMVQYFNELPGDKHLFPDILHKGNTIGVVLL